LVSGLVATQAVNAGLTRRERPAVERGELGFVERVGVHPLREQRDVDLGLPIRHVGRARRLDARWA